MSVAQLRVQAAQHGFLVHDGPIALQLDIGNLCNLTCRMCNAGASSRINRDPVHRAWTGPAHQLSVDPQLWFRQAPIVRRALAHSAELRHLHIIGGEPFLIDQVGDVLGALVDAGVAGDVDLSLHTNATRTTASWLPLTERFRSLVLYLSVDAVGPAYEYIRAPARWDRFVANVARLRQLPRAELRAHVVVQAYNALHLTELFEFLDGADIPFEAHLLDWPTCLRVATLPERARRQAATRLRSYARAERRPSIRHVVDGLATHLETVAGATADVLHELMVFTNDLDAARGQSFAATFPELVDLLARSGVRWTSETRHAEAPAQSTGSTSSPGASAVRVRAARRPRDDRAPRRANAAPTAKAAGSRSTSPA
jgi:hypothetical protein